MLALPAAVLQSVVEFAVDDRPGAHTPLRLVSSSWNRALSALPLRCRVHVLSASAQQADRVVQITAVSASPFAYPVVANVHGNGHADYFVLVELHAWSWEVLETHEALVHLLKDLVVRATGSTHVIIADVVANASQCQPAKFVDDIGYEDTLDDRKWCRYKRSKSPPLAAFRAVRIRPGGLTRWREYNLNYHDFPQLQQLVLHQDEWYLNKSFERHPTLAALDLVVDGWSSYEQYDRQIDWSLTRIRHLQCPHLSPEIPIAYATVGLALPAELGKQEDVRPLPISVVTLVVSLGSGVALTDAHNAWLAVLSGSKGLQTLVLTVVDIPLANHKNLLLSLRREHPTLRILLERMHREWEEPGDVFPKHLRFTC
ncbi:hypothetical protein ACHHYP_04749 [Achlya hypogyna]|uniref:Uncharacterized protein n=1 Tax=Achlya hypogyna TaxID=1202772 RepID=A0A1V9Z036_ACHHY|nr:hypothetical protein ACHHYP_04749 [Achlya hypogyna]